MLSMMKPYAAVNYIRGGIGYDDYCREYAKYRHIREEELLEVLDELQESAKEYQSYEAWFLHMEEYKEELERQAKEQKQQNCTFFHHNPLRFLRALHRRANDGKGVSHRWNRPVGQKR